MSPFWQQVLFKILVIWTNCKEPRTRNSDKIRCIIHNIEGYDAYDNHTVTKEATTAIDSSQEIQSPENQSKGYSNEQENPTNTKASIRTATTTEITHSIRAITSLFNNDKITREETEPFIHQLQPDMDQIEISNIPKIHRVSALFSVLTGKARTDATKFNITNMNIEDFTEALKKELCLDPNIRERKKHRWNNINYSQFRNKFQTEDEATRKCIDHFKAHQKDLPPYLLNDEALMERLRTIFKHQPWCQSLYERSSVGMSASAFEELLKTAASNADDRRNQPGPNTKTFPVTNTDQSTHHNHHDHAHDDITNLVAAFFASKVRARTPPPPRDRRPFRYRDNHPTSKLSHIPYALRRFRKGFHHANQCFGCLQQGHFFKDCPERYKYLKRFQIIYDLGTAAGVILDNADKEPDEEVMEIANFFVENDCFEDNYFEDFDVCICQRLDVCDKKESAAVNAILC